jgi:precorrin-3B C17-methyltransferase
LPSENKLYIVGLGPGGRGQMSLQAARALEKSDFIVGYHTYLDLVEDLLQKKQVASTSMGGEVERAKKAVDLLEEGSVSLISSGDPNIYGMAGLGLEMASGKVGLDRVEVVPGVTSFAAAACSAGVVFRDSLAVISLSDLLTPWNRIEDRLKLASELEMPLAIYNPRSRKRDWQLERALEMRFPGEKVLLGRNVSRPGESLRWVKAGELLESQELKDSVDMFTLAIVGGRGMARGDASSKSQINIVGIGPGDEARLTIEARETLESSDKVFGAERYLSGIRDVVRGEAVIHQGRCPDRMANRIEEARAAAQKGLRSSILTGGDPSVFSSAWRILDLAEAHICPGISAFSAVAAKAGAPLVNDFVLLSSPGEGSRASRLSKAGFAVVIYNVSGTDLPAVLEKMPEERPCVLAQDLARADEKFIAMRASDLLESKPSGNRFTLIVSGENSQIREGRVVTRRGYETRYSY